MRKTFNVDKFRQEINRKIKVSTCPPEGRIGMAQALELVLFETGNYKGFNYIEWLEGGYTQWVEDGKPDDTSPYIGDRSRVFYY